MSLEYHLQNAKKIPTEADIQCTRRSRSWSWHTQCCCGQISCRTSDTLPQREFAQLVGRKQNPISSSCKEDICLHLQILSLQRGSFLVLEKSMIQKGRAEMLLFIKKQSETYWWQLCILNFDYNCFNFHFTYFTVTSGLAFNQTLMGSARYISW